MRHPRNKKNQHTVDRIKVLPAAVNGRDQADKHIFDLVLTSLYNNADKSSLSFEQEILSPNNVILPLRESERIWNVMLSSGWVMPGIGFGNAGKLELSRTGYQLMALYGGYSQYLESINGAQSQTIIMPMPIEETKELMPAPHINPQRAAEKK